MLLFSNLTDGEDTMLDRRGFLTGIGAGSAYSLLVKADAADAPAPAGSKPGTAADWTPESEPNMTRVDLEGDFLVAGGGMAGTLAALAAARNGTKTILVQDRSRLGGNASSEIRMHIVGADCHGSRAGWREGGILEELRLENAVHNPHSAWELWDLLLYDKVVSEPNITLLLDSSVFRCEMDGDNIAAAWVRSDKTEHLYRVAASCYADCTGDCRLGLESGAAYRTGHEAREEFGEPLAPETAGPQTLGSSILFTSKKHDKPMPFTPPSWARKVTEEQLKFRGVGSWEYGYWWIEWGGMHDAIADNEMIRKELLSIVMGVWDYIKNSGNHRSSENWALDWVGMIPGKRSSRRMEGPIMVSQRDLAGEAFDFEDAVSIGGWSFDDHPPGGFDAVQERPARQEGIGSVYNLPLRCMYSKNVKNLFMAGRNISATHVAFTSTRVMATCAVAGQAVGTAAALCVEKGITPHELSADGKLVDRLQQMLLRDDQTIRDRKNEDPNDLALKATATASGSVDGSAPEHAINGRVRDMPGSWSNRWGGRVEKVYGAWLELAWDSPQKISHVQITFDSGFHRELTLSEQTNRQKKMVLAAQPETVKSYEVQIHKPDSGMWTTVATETNNYLRLRRHDFDTVETDALRILVHETNGSEEARIYEVRCYA